MLKNKSNNSPKNLIKKKFVKQIREKTSSKKFVEKFVKKIRQICPGTTSLKFLLLDTRFKKT